MDYLDTLLVVGGNNNEKSPEHSASLQVSRYAT
jgi:hypothetical protein